MDRILEIIRALLTATAEEAVALNTELDELWPTLTDAEVADAEASLLELFDGIRAGELAEDGIDARNVAALRTVSTQIEGVRALASTRIEAATAIDAEIAQLEAALAAEAAADAGAEPAAEPEPAPEPEAAAPAAPAEPEAEPAAEPELEAVSAAGRPALGQVARTQPRDRAPRVPSPTPVDPHVTLTASTGGRLESMTAAAEHVAREFNNMGANAGKRTLVEVRAEYPDELTLRESDSNHNGRIMEGIVAAGQDPASWSDDGAITAAGWCAPSPVDYGLVIQAMADRPVFDALPKVGMDRLGVRVPVSPTLSDVNVTPGDADAAISLFTEDDVDDDEFSKPIQLIDCPTFEDFRAYAIVKRLKFKNGAAVAYPENVAAWQQLAASAFARKAEGRLLGLIKNDAGTTKVTETNQVFGAAIDIVELILRLGAYMRSAERTGAQARLRAAIPAWVVDLMVADQARSGRAIYNDSDLVLARSKIIDMLTSANINPAFYLDTPLVPSTSIPDGPTQILPRQSTGAVKEWPCKVQFGLWFEGQYAVGDPGELNIGVVRDSALNAKNEFESFYEKYEGLVAHRGPEALWVTQDVLATGAFAAPIDGDISCADNAS